MKNRFLLYGAGIIIGILLTCIGGFAFTEDNVKAVSGVLIGCGSGLFGLSIASIISTYITDKNPAYKKRMVINEQDERHITIRNRAKAKAYDVMLLVIGVLILIYALLNTKLLVILLLVAAYLSISAVHIYYLSKYAKEM